MEGQQGKLDKFVARLYDARQVTDDGIQMESVLLMLAGEIVVPHVKHMQHRRFAVCAGRQFLRKKAVQKIRVIGHVVPVPPGTKSGIKKLSVPL